ncbi:MAG: RagB/SusD family nutrient uptake outer membrane protein [Bacteroidia bacterium]|nr:RagB/SusD family nutrient uptake outer membrane protein [Bacteroidia bacterium]
MKKIILILSISFAAILFPACEAIELDGLAPINSIPADGGITTKSSALAALNGLYDELQDPTLVYDGYIGLSSFYADETDFVGTFPSRLEFMNINVFPSNGTLDDVFTDFYDVINVANNVIEIIPTVEDVTFSDAEKNDAVGQAKFVRALTYWFLVNYFGEVPLITEPTRAVTPEALNLPKSSVENIYNQIDTDLGEAEANITTTSVGFANTLAVTALQARIALYRGDNATALSKAEEVITGIDLTTVPYLADQIFSLQFISTDGNSLPFFFGPDERGGRIDLVPSAKLVAAYEAGDTRFDRSIDTTGAVSSIVHGVKYQDFAGGAQGAGTDPVYFIRHAEIFLIAAEAAAATGDFTKANTYYNQVRNRAGLADGTLESSNYVDLILQERLVELAMEGPHRLFDLRRLGKTSEITGYDTCNDVWPIPQRDIDRNPNLAQNNCCLCN